LKNDVIWINRKFDFTLSIDLYPLIIERLRGTPARLEEKVKALRDNILNGKDGAAWSILETVGHLHDVEELWHGRINDFIAGEKEFRPADITNRVTKHADHNNANIQDLLASFRKSRTKLVNKFEKIDDNKIEYSAYHRRLDKQMRIIDLAYFIAEHDDHHLSKIQDMVVRFNG